MNTQNTRNLIASIVLALLVPVGILAALSLGKVIAAGFGVVAALAVLGGMELRGASRRLPARQPKGSIEIFRSVKSEA